jgi:hypothetical protein
MRDAKVLRRWSTNGERGLAMAALCLALSLMTGVGAVGALSDSGQSGSGIGLDYQIIATTKTSTMEKELNQQAENGFHFDAVMGGETAFGGKEVVAVMSRPAGTKAGRFAYRLLATSKTSTMQKELQDAADTGFQYRGQTVFKSAFGGDEVVCILERDSSASERVDYRLVATSKTSTLQKELGQAGAAGFQIVGMTVGKTALGGNELVAITRRVRAQ